jgi:predicted HAD superfamily phosphohydrolase YqeG
MYTTNVAEETCPSKQLLTKPSRRPAPVDEPRREPSNPQVRHRKKKRDWLLTVRQSVPKAFSVAKHLAPTFELRGAAEIDAHFLREHGIRGILWDVDGTLTHYHGIGLAPEAEPVRFLFEADWIRHGIVSNSDEVRYMELGRIFPDLPVLKLYELDGTTVGRRLEKGRDLWYAEGVGPGVPDPPEGEMEALRKPDARIMRFAVEQLGVPPEAVLMVGDQYWTDVAGAGLAGLRSAKVPTAGPSTFPPAIRAFQRIERWVRHAVA